MTAPDPSPDPTDRARLRRRLWGAFKLTLTAVFLVLVLRRMDLAELGQVLGELTPLAILGTVILTYASIAASTLRWQRVLAALGERVSYRKLLEDNLVATTYNLLLPTSIGGDVARGLRCGKRLEKSGDAWASVMFERVLGLLSLALFSCFGAFSVASGESGRQLFIASLVATGVLLGLLVLAPAPLRLAARVKQLGAHSLGQVLEQMATSFAGPLSRPLPRLEAFAWSIVYQLVALSILFVAGYSWNEPGLLTGVFLGVPIALVATTLPVTIGGFGLREGLFVAVLGLFAISPERALALSIVWLGSNLVLALTGAVVMATERSKGSQSRRP